MSHADHLYHTYDTIAAKGLEVFQQGTVQTDPHLLDIPGDTRRGTTLLLRPAEPARQNILDAIAELDQIVPGQYNYTGEQLHITVLSVISAAEGNPPRSCASGCLFRHFCRGVPPERADHDPPAGNYRQPGLRAGLRLSRSRRAECRARSPADGVSGGGIGWGDGAAIPQRDGPFVCFTLPKCAAKCTASGRMVGRGPRA